MEKWNIGCEYRNTAYSSKHVAWVRYLRWLQIFLLLIISTFNFCSLKEIALSEKEGSDLKIWLDVLCIGYVLGTGKSFV